MKVTEKSAKIKLEFSGIQECSRFLKLLDYVDRTRMSGEDDEWLDCLKKALTTEKKETKRGK